MEFEWDPDKEAINRQKHGFSFLDAIRVFNDPFQRIEESTRPEFGEERLKVIGRVDTAVLAVIFTDRADKRRIISARRARRNERRAYDQSSATT